MKKHFRIFHHSLTMVGRTLRSYMLLSVTIVLSFSLLLGYLGFVDSEIYNEYKYIFKINRGHLKVDDGTSNSERFDALVEKVSEIESTCFYTVYHSWSQMSDCCHAVVAPRPDLSNYNSRNGGVCRIRFADNPAKLYRYTNSGHSNGP